MDKKILKITLVLLIAKTVLGLSYIYELSKLLFKHVKELFGTPFFDIENLVNDLTLLFFILSSISLIVGMLMMIQERKVRLNIWIKIPAIYYSFTFIFLGIPNLFRIDFDLMKQQFSTIQSIRYWINLAVTAGLTFFYAWHSMRYMNKLDTQNYEIVSEKKGLRFLNYLIDTLVISIISFDLLLLLHQFDLRVDFIFILMPTSFFYYLFQEYIYRQSIGKVFTNTIVTINGDYKLKLIIIRSLSRHIPFEPFSFIFGNKQRWHDKYSNTLIKELK